MKKYGVVESWTKLLNFESPLKTLPLPKAIGITKTRALLLQFCCGELASYNGEPIDQALDSSGNYFIQTYVQSLVLLDRANHYTTRGGIRARMEIGSDDGNGPRDSDRRVRALELRDDALQHLEQRLEQSLKQ
ncbi:hypothetical protein GH714_018016 [Hevea brasiliensis]|uniref:Uncharacterized protein n=1 Tax=Hevea brasiliensis TaxID=3981 RepID=A0A6A6N2P5_HEVBR|nr:hypothetical protein GH714_018016 [Hevea brasiliensis]